MPPLLNVKRFLALVWMWLGKGRAGNWWWKGTIPHPACKVLEQRSLTLVPLMGHWAPSTDMLMRGGACTRPSSCPGFVTSSDFRDDLVGFSYLTLFAWWLRVGHIKCSVINGVGLDDLKLPLGLHFWVIFWLGFAIILVSKDACGEYPCGRFATHHLEALLRRMTFRLISGSLFFESKKKLRHLWAFSPPLARLQCTTAS